jgi:acyl-CoA thioester hydrolase
VSTQSETRLRVRYAETDQMGVVYHANYYVWMELGRVDFVRGLGFDYHQMEQSEGLFLSVVETECRYICPARFDQEIVVRTTLKQANARLAEFHYEICDSATNRLLARGRTKHMWLNREFKPAKLPSHYLRLLRQANL